MKFLPTDIAGTWLIVPEPIEDERGSFARVFCKREFEANGLNPELVQCSTSFNRKAGTLRGLHFQAEPHGEDKIVRCTRGSIFDIVADLRTNSPSYRRWVGLELTADNRRMVYVPRGAAHGFLTLSDDSEILYQMSQFYRAESARGVRWDDPSLGIQWPRVPSTVSERDRGLPCL